MTTDELDNYMFNRGLSLIESTGNEDDKIETIRYTNCNSQVWVEVERDNQLILITSIKLVNKVKEKKQRENHFIHMMIIIRLLQL